MLSEEEKKAIELLKQEPDFSLRYYERENAIDIILNLIEKQSKEIEELNKENLEIRDWKYVIDLDKLKELDLIKIKGKEYISKDKIKEKIEDYTEKAKHPLVNPQSREEYTFGIRTLQLLLEEG